MGTSKNIQPPIGTNLSQHILAKKLLVIRQYDFVVLTIIYYKISAPLHNSIFLEVPKYELPFIPA